VAAASGRSGHLAHEVATQPLHQALELGVALGLVVSIVLVHVVNPQSFHWTMELLLPWGRLTALFAAVLVAGSVTAALCAKSAARQDAVLAVKEDW